MARRRAAEKRIISPDTKYGSVIVAKLINYLMLDGKKAVAEIIVCGAISSLSQKIGKDPVEAFEEVVENVKPLIEVKSRRVGGSTYQVPVEIKESRAVTLALKWIVAAARKRKSGSVMREGLFAELVDAYSKKGVACKKREDTHKMAESNKAFAHYRW